MFKNENKTVFEIKMLFISLRLMLDRYFNKLLL